MVAFIRLLLMVITLPGVVGDGIRTRAFFDANNVKVGDPLTLTVDFLGDADFKSLHPPALSRVVGSRDWRLDDASAKTDTYRDARRLTYRVRPIREGLLWFPELEFEYVDSLGVRKRVKTNTIPVHAKQGVEVAIAGMDESVNGMPQPAELVTSPDVQLSADDDFQWRKACASPTAEAFAQFDFPAAQMNRARMLTLSGSWAEALSVYRKLEWRIGQTPEMERGIIAALAVRYDNPSVELPIWRQVLRPLLVYDWKGRLLIVLGVFSLVWLMFWLVGRGIRAVACLAVLLLTLPTSAQGLFEQIENLQRQMHQQMQQAMGSSFGGGFFGETEEQPNFKISARLSTNKKQIRVGDEFEFIIALDAPKNASIGQLRITPTQRFGMTVTGNPRNLEDGKSESSSNVVKRLAIPVRYDCPLSVRAAFVVDGMVSAKRTRNGGRFSFSFSNSFQCKTDSVLVKVMPLPSEGQPVDYSGIVSEGLVLIESPDITKVETNDVVKITYVMKPRGFVPLDYMLPGVAFEWGREHNSDNLPVTIEYRRFFVADGTGETPRIKVVYYNPKTKRYAEVETGGTPLKYTASKRKE